MTLLEEAEAHLARVEAERRGLGNASPEAYDDNQRRLNYWRARVQALREAAAEKKE